MARGHSSRVHPPLERAPGKRDNWVEANGGLPSYVKRIAKHLRDDEGMTTSRAIASAINTVKRWARGGGSVKPQTRAQAAKALAQWQALKAKAKANRTADLSHAAPRQHGAVAPWRHDSGWELPGFAPHGAVWDLAQVSTHGWVPNNPITALKWRKGHWTPPGGSPISAAQIRERLGAKTNRDAIRILQTRPSAIDKVKGEGVTRRPARTTPRTKRASTRKAWDATVVRRPGAIRPVESIRRGDVFEDPAGNPVIMNGVRTIQETDSDGRNPMPMVEVSAFRPTSTGTRKASLKADQGTPVKFTVEPGERMNVVGRYDQGATNRPAPENRLRGPRGGRRGPGRPLPADRQLAAIRRAENETNNATVGTPLRAPGADPTRRQTLKPNTAPSAGARVDRADVARRAAQQRAANAPAEATGPVSPDMGRQTLTGNGWVPVARAGADIPKRPVRPARPAARPLPERAPAREPMPKRPVRPARPAARPLPENTAARPSADTPAGRQAVRRQQRATQQSWTETAQAQRAQVERQSATAPRRRGASQDARTTRQPSGEREGALFGLTGDQKQAQKTRVQEAIASYAPGSVTAAANKLLRGEPLVRRERNRDGDTVTMVVQRDPDGEGWAYRVEGPTEDLEGRGLSLPAAIKGVREGYEENSGDELPVRQRRGATASGRQSSTAAPAESPRSPAGRDLNRPFQEVAAAEVDAEQQAAEERRQSRLPALRERLAAAERDLTAYEKRHPTASTRSRTVRTRLDDKQQAVRRARAQLAEAEVGEAGPSFRMPTQLDHTTAREEATKAGKAYVTYRDRLRRSGQAPTARQQAEIGRRYDRAAAAHRRLIEVERARSEGEQRAARADAAQPFRVQVSGQSETRGFPNLEAAESAARDAGFRGALAQVVTRDGQVRVTYNRSNESASRTPMTVDEANAAYESRRTDYLSQVSSSSMLASYAEDYQAQADKAGLPAAERAMFGRLATLARERAATARTREDQEQRARNDFREQTRTLQDRANAAFQSGNLEEAERAATDLMGVLRDNPLASDEQRTSASRALDRIQEERGTAPSAPESDAQRIGQLRESLEANREARTKLQESWSASIRRNGSGTVSARVQANRDRMQARATELRTERRAQERALFEALHPETKPGTPTVTEVEGDFYTSRQAAVDFPDGTAYTVRHDRYGNVDVSRQGLRVSASKPEGSQLTDAEYAARLGATLDRILSQSRQTQDAYGRPVHHFRSRDDLASALARVEDSSARITHDPVSGEWSLSTTAPANGVPYLESEPGGGWVLRGAGAPQRIHDRALTADHLRVLSRSTQDVDVSHESARTGYQTAGELTGLRRLGPRGGVEVQIRFPNGATQWVPVSVVADQLSE